MFLKRHFLLALAMCAVLWVTSRDNRRITAAFSDIAVQAEGSFTRDGQYPSEPFADAVNVRGWGSWSGSDENQGTLTLGPFPAPRVLRFGVGGYPNNPGNELFIERADTNARLPITTGSIGERWRVMDFELPAKWKGHSIRLVAIDHAGGLGGWLAITEPIRGGRSDGNNALLESLTAWAVHALLLGLIYFAAIRWQTDRAWLPAHWIPLGAAAVVALCGYATFWAYFASPLLGKILSSALLVGAAFFCLRPRSSAPLADAATTTKLLLAIGGFYLGLLHLFPTQLDFYTLAANRYRENLPADNVLPHAIAERLYHGQAANQPLGDWRSSDRPPLQAGWQLLTWHATKLLSLHPVTASGTAAMWFQSLWILAAYGFLRSLGVTLSRAAAWVAVCALSGFFVQNTVFTWPKLSAGAFACGAFALWAWRRGEEAPEKTCAAVIAGAIFAGLAWLSHGGAAFSLITIMPWVLWRAWRGETKSWIMAAAALVLLALPWHLYQRFYDPPGDRLLKWHLAGQIARDESRSAWQTIRESYHAKPALEIWAIKGNNVREVFQGNFLALFDVRPAGSADRRQDEFFHTVRGLTWWPVLALLALVATSRRVFSADDGRLRALGIWIAATTGVWCLAFLMVTQAVIHQGSYAVMIGAFVVCSVVLERTGPRWLAVIAVLQAVTLATTWAVANPTVHGPLSGLLFVIITGGALAWIAIDCGRRTADCGVTSPASSPDTSSVDSSPQSAIGSPKFQSWWQNPQLNLWVLLALAVVLFLRKPYALHTPQLYAEDGSIFLMQNDAHGISAWFLPYMGYLHLLPRLIAWTASHLLDPASWPAFYNGVSFAIWIGVLARLFSRRLDLPAKPWLALAFVLGPNTGEVLFNITNLQWLTAFVLLQQALIARPENGIERAGDLACVMLAGLTGPFVVVFAPLFAWRWWRERHRDNLVLLLAVTACAAVQAWFVVRTGPKFDYQSAPFHLLDTINVVARRLLMWPLVGDRLASSLPPRVIGVVGGALIVALLGWSLRPHARRHLRATIVVAFGLILLAGVYRTRPDTWAADNLVYADRYFYIPRVLLMWLLIWELDAIPRAVAVVARLMALTIVLVHLRDYQIAAPIDYHWAQHVEPIRRGVPANIPTLPEGWTLEYHGRPGGK